MRRAAQILAGVTISAAGLWFTLHDKDLGAVWAAVQAADYVWLAPYFGAMALIHLAQTLRWGILLQPLARIPFWRLNAVAAVGFMALVLLPFRLGELARPYLIAERPHLRVSAALSSVVTERIADGLFTAALLVVTLLAIPNETPGVAVLRLGGVAVFLAFAAALGILLLARRHRETAKRLIRAIVNPVSARLADRVTGMIDAFFEGLRLVPTKGRVALFFGLTGAYWGLSAWTIALLGRAFAIELSAWQSLTVLGVLVVGTMIPAGPGMVGTYQAAVVLGLSLFLPASVVDARGVAFANVLWAGQVAWLTLLGTAFLFSRHVRIGAALMESREARAA